MSLHRAWSHQVWRQPHHTTPLLPPLNEGKGRAPRGVWHCGQGQQKQLRLCTGCAQAAAGPTRLVARFQAACLPACSQAAYQAALPCSQVGSLLPITPRCLSPIQTASTALPSAADARITVNDCPMPTTLDATPAHCLPSSSAAHHPHTLRLPLGP